MSLALFLTAGVSLRDWAGRGILERELALYRALRDRGVQTLLVSYGGPDDAALAPDFRVLCNVFRLPRHWYARLMPWLHGRALRAARVFKSNQTDGAEVALRCARLLRRPLVARSGYPWARTLAEKLPPDAWEIGYSRRVEREVAGGCRRWMVTTEAAAGEIRSAHPEHAGKIRVVPNAVDTGAFQPRAGERDVDVLWIGRLEEEKRPRLLLEALHPGVRAVMIGQGSQLDELRALADARGLSVRFTGALAHADIAAWLNRASVYAITSRYEGHPKSLLEAMACGLACLGVDVRGIREQLRTGDTGWLCDGTPGGLRDALERLLGDPGLRARLGEAARREIVEHFSLRSVVEREISVLSEAVESP